MATPEGKGIFVKMREALQRPPQRVKPEVAEQIRKRLGKIKGLYSEPPSHQSFAKYDSTPKIDSNRPGDGMVDNHEPIDLMKRMRIRR